MTEDVFALPRGLRVIVTAGASGIGRAISDLLITRGARVHVCDVSDEFLTTFRSNKRTSCKVDRSRGGATDGATVDAEGGVWRALVYDGRLVRYTPDGKVDRVIEMPVKKVTSMMFGGPNLDVLFVTSMAKPPLPRFPGDGPLRGSLFAIYDLGVRGVPESRFAG